MGRLRQWGSGLAIAVAAIICPSQAATSDLPSAKDRWIRVDTGHFTLISNVSGYRTMRIGHKLEQLRAVLSEISTNLSVDSPLPTRIYVFKDQKSFRPYNLGENDTPLNWSGYFVGTPEGNYIAIDDSAGAEPFGVIFHEYLHDFVRNNLPRAPLWLSEGLAELYSNFQTRSRRAEIGRPIPRHLLWLATRPMIPLDELFALDPSSADYNEGLRQGTIYAQSWALVHYLLVDEQRRSKANELLRLLAQGVDSKRAFERVFDTDLKAIEAALGNYVDGESYGYLKVPLPDTNPGRGVLIEPLDRRESLYLLSDLLMHHPPVSREAVERHLDAILALDANYIEAWLGRAHLELHEERPGVAMGHCERSRGLAPDDGRVHALCGQAQVAQFRQALLASPRAAVERSRDLLGGARESFRKALEANPDDLQSLIGLGRSYQFDRDDAAEGVDALSRAAALLPGRLDVLVDLISLIAHGGDVVRAQDVLERTLHVFGDATSIAAAEGAIVGAEMIRARKLDRSGKHEESTERLREVARRVRDTRLKLTLWTRLAAMSAPAAEEDIVRSFNQAVIAADHGDSRTAIALLEKVIAHTGHPDLKAAAETHLNEVRRIARHNRIVGRYNEAVRMARGGNLERAEGILNEVLSGELDSDLLVRSRGLLREVRRARITVTAE